MAEIAISNETLPIHRIPNEIVQDIFVQCAYADQNDEGHSLLSTNKAPLVLSYVCSAWRQLALYTPELWCRLHIEWTARKQWSPALLGQLWLSRCKSIPIHLSIYEREDGYSGYKNTGTHFASRYATRLSSLSLNHVRNLSIKPAFDQFGSLCFPILQHLELKGWTTIILPYIVDSRRFPQLSSYKLEKVAHFRGLGLTLDKSKSLSGCITHLDLHKVIIREDELEVVVNTYPLLSKLGITVEFELESKFQRQRQIVLTNLHRLKLTLTDGQPMFDQDGDLITPSLIFSRLSAPNLIALDTDYNGEPIPHDNYYVAKAVYEFIQRSQCALQELSISGWEYDDSLNGTRVLELANTIPTLRKLAYDGVLGGYGYCSQSLSVHNLHEPTDVHPLIRVKGGEWEFLPLLEELRCHVETEGLSLMGYDIEETVLPEGVEAINRRMKSSFGGLKCCQATMITRRPSGISEVVSDALISLTKLGLTYTIRGLKSREEEKAETPYSGIQPPFVKRGEEWTAYSD